MFENTPARLLTARLFSRSFSSTIRPIVLCRRLLVQREPTGLSPRLPGPRIEYFSQIPLLHPVVGTGPSTSWRLIPSFLFGVIRFCNIATGVYVSDASKNDLPYRSVARNGTTSVFDEIPAAAATVRFVRVRVRKYS